MLSVKEAQAQILQHFHPVDTAPIPLAQAAGRVLAENIHAESDLPAFDNSSVDGFALRAADARPGASLPVVMDIPAGSVATDPIQPGQAARIMTGAAIPPGADAVIMVEDTDFAESPQTSPPPQSVQLNKTIQPGENIRRKGSDLSAGALVLRARRRLNAPEAGMLAMLGCANPLVYRKPRVALLSSGDEILPVDEPLTPGKIHDTNSYTLSALTAGMGCEVLPLGVAADRADSVQVLLDEAIRLQADVIISSAGVSVGAFDFVKNVVEQHGSLSFWKVNMRPGKPLAFGHYRNTPFFGLPGNPVSAFVGFLVFVQPALERLSGLQTEDRPRVSVVLAEAVESDGRESYLRAVASIQNGEYVARLTGHQGSGNLFSLVQANALLIIPSGVKSLAPGSRVDAWLI